MIFKNAILKNHIALEGSSVVTSQINKAATDNLGYTVKNERSLTYNVDCVTDCGIFQGIFLVMYASYIKGITTKPSQLFNQSRKASHNTKTMANLIHCFRVA